MDVVMIGFHVGINLNGNPTIGLYSYPNRKFFGKIFRNMEECNNWHVEKYEHITRAIATEEVISSEIVQWIQLSLKFSKCHKFRFIGDKYDRNAFDWMITIMKAHNHWGKVSERYDGVVDLDDLLGTVGLKDVDRYQYAYMSDKHGGSWDSGAYIGMMIVNCYRRLTVQHPEILDAEADKDAR